MMFPCVAIPNALTEFCLLPDSRKRLSRRLSYRLAHDADRQRVAPESASALTMRGPKAEKYLFKIKY